MGAIGGPTIRRKSIDHTLAEVHGGQSEGGEK